MIRRGIALVALAAILAGGAALATMKHPRPDSAAQGGQMAQHTHSHSASPYAGEESRDIKALDRVRLSALLEGDGLGYAKAAELNAYPGPRHALELADELAMSPEQRQRMRGVFARMQAEAAALGREIVANERRLDRAFAEQNIDALRVESIAQKIGQLEGRLRAVHLNAHLEAKALMTPAQVARYAELRGYRASAAEADDLDGRL